MSRIRCFLCGAESYNSHSTKLYCFSCYDLIVKERDKLRDENDVLREALRLIQALYYNNPSNAYANFFLALSIVDKVLNEVTK